MGVTLFFVRESIRSGGRLIGALRCGCPKWAPPGQTRSMCFHKSYESFKSHQVCFNVASNAIHFNWFAIKVALFCLSWTTNVQNVEMIFSFQILETQKRHISFTVFCSLHLHLAHKHSLSHILLPTTGTIHMHTHRANPFIRMICKCENRAGRFLAINCGKHLEKCIPNANACIVDHITIFPRNGWA